MVESAGDSLHSFSFVSERLDAWLGMPPHNKNIDGAICAHPSSYSYSVLLALRLIVTGPKHAGRKFDIQNDIGGDVGRCLFCFLKFLLE